MPSSQVTLYLSEYEFKAMSLETAQCSDQPITLCLYKCKKIPYSPELNSTFNMLVQMYSPVKQPSAQFNILLCQYKCKAMANSPVLKSTFTVSVQLLANA